MGPAGLPLAFLLISALPVRGATYYLTVAGLGGEPEYEQQFTGLAKDLDKALRPPAWTRMSRRFSVKRPRASD